MKVLEPSAKVNVSPEEQALKTVPLMEHSKVPPLSVEVNEKAWSLLVTVLPSVGPLLIAVLGAVVSLRARL